MKNILSSVLAALLLSLAVHSAPADANGNGMSDAWERRFNGYKLFPGSILPEDDADGDGISNFTECIAGTDPFNGVPPLGLLQAEVRHVPAVHTTTEGSEPLLVSPEAFVISWPTQFGKLYTLHASPDLSAGSWVAIGQPEYGYGQVIEIAALPTYSDGTVADKFFWRVAVTDTDSDGDGLTDAEEHLLNIDEDHDGVPDEYERRISSVLFADYGIISPTDPAQFDVNVDYGGINTSAALVYHGLAGDFDLATTEVVASPFVEGSMKTVEQHKSGFVEFPQLYPPSPWLETGPALNFYRKLHTDYHYDYGEEMPLISTVFAWTEMHGHCIQNEIYAWNVTQGWETTLEKEAQNYTSETWQWWDDYPSPPVDWYIHDYFEIYNDTYEVGVSGDPPALPNNRIVGQWSTNTPTLRVGAGAQHSSGTQAVKPVPSAGYSPTFRTSETFTLSQELSAPYTTDDLIADAGTALAAAASITLSPVSYRNLVENESKISLCGGKYRLGWNIPANVPVHPGNSQVKAVFLWQEVTDSEAAAGPVRMIKWKHELVNTTPSTLAQTQWHDIPPPDKDGASWIRSVSPHGSITLPGAILVNNDDDDANGQEDRTQASLLLGTENDLIAVNFEATAPGADEQAMIYRLEAIGAGKVRLWEAFPNQQPQLVALPYKLQIRDYTGGAEPRPTYYIEATQAGSVSLQLYAEVLGRKLALVATAEFKSLEILIDLAANMKGVIGDIVQSNLPNSKVVHFVTTKSTTQTDSVSLTASGISGEEATPQHAKQLVEWVGAAPVFGYTPTAEISRSATGKYPVSIRLLGTGQTTASTMVWVTWAYLSAQSSTDGQTPLMMAPQDVFSPPPNSAVAVGYKFSGKLLWRYVCEPTEMFNLTSDVPDFTQAPTVPAPGIHPWTGASLAPGAALRYDASRQVRVVARSNDSTIDQLLHDGRPDIATYPSDAIEGNDDPDLGAETFPYQPLGTTAVLSDADYPNIELLNSIGSSNPSATIFELAQFRQFARVQIGAKWYLCSDYGLTELTRKLRRDNGRWIDDGSTFVPGNNSTFPPP
jgi:hypothetical protein